MIWRLLILAPVIWVAGFCLLVIVLGAFIAPPIYAAFAIASGEWLVGTLALGAWSLLLWFRRPVLGWTLQGMEYAGI